MLFFSPQQLLITCFSICFFEFKGKQFEKVRSPFQFKPILQRSQSEGVLATQFTPQTAASHGKISCVSVFPNIPLTDSSWKGNHSVMSLVKLAERAWVVVCSSSGRVVQTLWSSRQEQLSALQPGTQAHSTFSVVITRHIVTVTVGQIDFWHRSSCKL